MVRARRLEPVALCSQVGETYTDAGQELDMESEEKEEEEEEEEAPRRSRNSRRRSRRKEEEQEEAEPEAKTEMEEACEGLDATIPKERAVATVAPEPSKAGSARLAERLLRGECAPEAAYEAEGQKLTNQDIAYMLAVLARRELKEPQEC